MSEWSGLPGTRKKEADTLPDFLFQVSGEKRSGEGEDSYYYSCTKRQVVLAVFDGCGGSGARRYDRFQFHTGAYMASRTVAGAVRDWAETLRSGSGSGQAGNAKTLKRGVQEYLEICRREGCSAGRLSGSLLKSFPTTMAMVVSNDGQEYSCYWAGDSRCYLLDGQGLRQLTRDDTGDADAMENLLNSGRMTNVISAEKDFVIHQKKISVSKPCIVFAATDGCFGYVSSPMEFEWLLLETLMHSSGPADWETQITAALKRISGDDFTLCGAAYGFGSFEALVNTCAARHTDLKSRYIAGIEGKSITEKRQVWEQYRAEYEAYL